jgi:hypothetical protein
MRLVHWQHVGNANRGLFVPKDAQKGGHLGSQHTS